jgi:hypothetical protein
MAWMQGGEGFEMEMEMRWMEMDGDGWRRMHAIQLLAIASFATSLPLKVCKMPLSARKR